MTTRTTSEEIRIRKSIRAKQNKAAARERAAEAEKGKKKHAGGRPPKRDYTADLDKARKAYMQGTTSTDGVTRFPTKQDVAKKFNLPASLVYKVSLTEDWNGQRDANVDDTNGQAIEVARKSRVVISKDIQAQAKTLFVEGSYNDDTDERIWYSGAKIGRMLDVHVVSLKKFLVAWAEQREQAINASASRAGYELKRVGMGGKTYVVRPIVDTTSGRAPGRPKHGFDNTISWIDIENAFVQGVPMTPEEMASKGTSFPIRYPTLDELSRRYGVTKQAIHQRSQREHWLERRDAFVSLVKTKSDEKVADTLALSIADVVRVLDSWVQKFQENLKLGRVRADTMGDLNTAVRLREFVMGNADERSQVNVSLSLDALAERHKKAMAQPAIDTAVAGMLPPNGEIPTGEQGTGVQLDAPKATIDAEGIDTTAQPAQECVDAQPATDEPSDDGEAVQAAPEPATDDEIEALAAQAVAVAPDPEPEPVRPSPAKPSRPRRPRRQERTHGDDGPDEGESFAASLVADFAGLKR